MRPGARRQLHRGVWAGLLGLLGTSVVVLAGSAAPAAADIAVNEVYGRPSNGVFLVKGHGWGHGRGMSQYGANGAATIGKTADQITSTYYPSTTKVALTNSTIKVQLRDLNSASESAVFDTTVFAATGLYATDLATGTAIGLDTTKSKWRVRVRSTDGKLLLEGLSGSTWTAKNVYTGPIQFARPSSGANPIRVLFPSGYSRDYRGYVLAVKRTTALNTIALMPMETYLRGVVPRESISSWPANALQAQAIAARSYSAWHRNNSRAKGLPYDICNTTACQVFGGSAVYSPAGTRTPLEVASTDDAVLKTANLVRWYGGGPIFAEFSSSNGGWSTDGGVPYMVAKADPWDGITGSSVHSWNATLPVSALEDRYSPKDPAGTPLWRFVRLTVKQRDGNGEWGGRVLSTTGAVTLDFVEKADATLTHSVASSGSGIYSSYTWPAHSDGLRSRWWRITPLWSASVVSRSSLPVLVQAPGNPRATATVVLQNTGSETWPAATVHLALASPPGGADPLVHGSTQPGAFVKNVTTGDQSSIGPGQRAQFAIPMDATSLPAGTRTASYRARVGTGGLFGSTAVFTVTIQDARLTGVRGAAPALVSSTLVPAPGAPSPLFSDRTTVVVPRTGSTTVRLTTKNTGNVTWPVGASSPVMTCTSNPRNHNSPFAASPSWVSASCAARAGGTTAVTPGRSAVFDVALNGNGRPAGVTSEAFEPVWQGEAWIGGHQTRLQVVRVDTAVSRAAVTHLAPPTSTTLANSPMGKALVVRLRNVGRDPWKVGQERLGTAQAYALRSGWPSSTRTPALRANLSRPGVAEVHPGEVGEWLVPVSAFGKAVGTYSTTLRAVGPTGFYGPSLPISVSVVAASFTWDSVKAGPSVDVPSRGTRWTYFDIRNTSNFDWRVGGSLRSSVPSGSSPSRATSWYSATRPGSLTQNLSHPGSTVLRPGEVGRFRILLAGNGRSPRTTSEVFGMSWDGWRSTSLKVTLAYRVVS
jgi:hypothetical protein